MASIVRTGYLKLSPCGVLTGLCKKSGVKNSNLAVTQVAWITGKALREDRPPRPPPFDWRNKGYKLRHAFTDYMVERMDDNSKIVIVDGLPGVGKEKFAKKLADELEMVYLPVPTFDDHHIDAYGFDYRSLNSSLPIDAQYYDDKMFHADPKGRNSMAIQLGYYFFRLSVYIDALAHVFSTGEGVVLQRSPWADIVFAKAMLTSGYVSPGAFEMYRNSLENSLHRLLRPHLILYLDIPAEKSLENIKKRGRPHETNSKALTLKFLQDVEKNYKNYYIPTISQHAHVLIYDWLEEGEFDFIVDDIEGLQFEGYGREDSKMEDWRFSSIDWMRAYRSIYHNDKLEIMNSMIATRLDVPEMIVPAQDVARKTEILEKLAETRPSTRYAEGFNPDIDKDVLWKTHEPELYPGKKVPEIQSK